MTRTSRKRLKILFVETYTHVAGGQKGLLDLVEYMNKDEFEPVVLVQGPGRLKDELDKRGVRSVSRRLEPFKNRWLPFSWLIGVRPVLKVIAEERPDVVHSNHLYVGRYSGRAARRAGVPCLVTLRLVHTPEMFDRQNRWDTLKCHDRVVSNSDEGRVVFESDPEVRTRILTIKNGIDLEKFRPLPNRAEMRKTLGRDFGLSENSLVIAQIASMVPQKGNEELTRVFIDLCGAHPDLDLHLILVGGPFGRTDNSSVVRKLAAEAGLEHRVHLTSYVRNVEAFLNLADISVLCSREREGLPRSIIEAMACGNPVVGTDVGAMRELIHDGENGYLIPASDEETLRARLDTLIRDADLRRRMGAEGLRIAREHHDIRIMLERYQAIYRELARAHGAAAHV
jgi:glycosyltransferase involved in cell wall biosynthesis